MGLVSKILGQANPGAVLTNLYTVPNGALATVTVMVCNTSVFTDTFRIAIAVAGAADALSQYIAYDMQLPPNSNQVVGPFYMRPLDVLRVRASDSTVSFTALGQESTS